MKRIKIASYALVGMAALITSGFALPRHVSVERSATLAVSAQTVLALAASNQGYQRFNPYQTLDPDLKIDLFGPQNGVGSGFSFNSKDGTGTQTVASVTPDRVVFAVDLGPMGQPTQSIRAVPVPGGSEVTWRMESDMGFNPISRFVGLFLDGMVGPTFELGLEKLGKAAA